jgi:hypothetical protein
MSRRNKVVEHLFGVLQPSLEANGFVRTAASHAYRDHGATIDVLKIEFFDGSTHRVWGTSSHSFGISCGIFLRFAPNPFGGRIAQGADGSLEPDVTVCAIRTHLFRKLPQPKNVPKNVWSIASDLSDLAVAVSDVKNAFDRQAVQWFARFANVREITELLQNADEQMDGDAPCFGFGRKGSPVRNLYLGFSAAFGGDDRAARMALVASMSKGGFAQLSGSAAVDDLVRSKLAALQA